MDTFRGQDNKVLKELFDENFCKVVIVPHNLTNKFQSLDISVNKPAKAFISNKYNSWFWKQVSAQLAPWTDPSKVKVSAKLSDIKTLHAQWIVDLYNHMCVEKYTIIGISRVGLRLCIFAIYDSFSQFQSLIYEISWGIK